MIRMMMSFHIALSLTQPWASLVAIGAKRFETRKWKTNYRGPLLIHAAQRMPVQARRLALEEPFLSALRDTYWHIRGRVIAMVNLVDCIEIGAGLGPIKPMTPDQIRNEMAFGDWRPGRYAWRFDDVVRFPEPFYHKGFLGLFNVHEYAVMLATELWEKHPEWYSGPCQCKACLVKAGSVFQKVHT
ncbi:MAG TPA: ASCH domain-containing protein [Candidatus Acidoferrales bacterium]|nr:ASCH domain-containing protein [Candidatus Acidoferrales bacterium]